MPGFLVALPGGSGMATVLSEMMSQARFQINTEMVKETQNQRIAIIILVSGTETYCNLVVLKMEVHMFKHKNVKARKWFCME